MYASFLDINGHTGVCTQEGQFIQSDGDVGVLVRGEAEVVSEDMASASYRRVVEVRIRRRNALAVAPATSVRQRRKGSKNRVTRNGENVSPRRVPLFMSMDGVRPRGVLSLVVKTPYNCLHVSTKVEGIPSCLMCLNMVRWSTA
jgi:hypothetical protein